MDRILLIEDDPEAQNLVTECLRHLSVVTVSNLQSANLALEASQFDLILLDIILPDGDGMQFYQKLQQIKNPTPVIFITGKNASSDREAAFLLGAEDYISKPFDFKEFKARIDAKLKKYHAIRENENQFQIGNLHLILSEQRAYLLRDEGQEINLNLTPHEFKLLTILTKKQGTLVSREFLTEAMRGTDIHLFYNATNSHLSNLRRKLRQCTHTISSVYGQGYALISVISLAKGPRKKAA